MTTGRYKAVDDLLYHNIEAYTGMPALFFAWALSDKKVHFEFLDNSVPLGSKPKTVAAGWNGSLTVFDVSVFLDVERFRKINVDAQKACDLASAETTLPFENTSFLKDCAERLKILEFADTRTGRVYGVIENGCWVYQDRDYFELHVNCSDTIAGLTALGFGEYDKTISGQPNLERFAHVTGRTFGHLGFS